MTLAISDIYLCPNSITNVTGTMRVSIGSVTGVASCATLNVAGGSTWSISTLTGVNICDLKANTSITPQVNRWSLGSASNNTYCTCFPGLPVELLYFDARMIDKVVKLRWITESEINNDYFTVERSQEGLSFETVDIVPGAGNSTSPRQYHTQDAHPYQGTSYYRLKQTDYDGKYSYSRIASVSTDEESGLVISYFYPIGNQIFYQVTGADGEELSVELLDVLGRQVVSSTVSGGEEQGFNIPVSGLSPGIYMFKVTDGNNIAIKKFYYSE